MPLEGESAAASVLRFSGGARDLRPSLEPLPMPRKGLKLSLRSSPDVAQPGSGALPCLRRGRRLEALRGSRSGCRGRVRVPSTEDLSSEAGLLAS